MKGIGITKFSEFIYNFASISFVQNDIFQILIYKTKCLIVRKLGYSFEVPKNFKLR